ncbi:hypothetical protein N7456_010422 [Penicillium angulare]|uniref:Protein-lysine N-methyltransferase EFM4 n=1 Tax=Penicillium angulare TaxID=116970 RepID=A0A9W9K6Q2_9EURO|nr:hypothetical protein N7456_010422 [Penicillium angulare]
MAEEHPTYLSPSELGSKDYWETYYARTLAHISTEKPTQDAHANAASNSDSDSDDLNDEDDPGTSWFSEHNAPEKVLKFLTKSSFPLSPRNRNKATSKTKTKTSKASILDLGTGNGSMLALLRKRGGYTGRMVGVDYSAQSVELARELQRTRGHSAYHSGSEDESSSEDEAHEDEEEKGSESETETEIPQIQFEEWDILSSTATLSPNGSPVLDPAPGSGSGSVSTSSEEERLPWFPYKTGGFDIVLDKGTFDAISLADNAKETNVCERYPFIVRQLLRNGGYLIVTSCNWTEEELVKWFTQDSASGSAQEGAGDKLIVWGRVEYPRFRFGGAEGQGVCTVCFQRVVSASASS